MTTQLRAPSAVFAVSLLSLILAEVLRVYWIMPFPGSQSGETLALAYALHGAMFWLRIGLGALAAISAFVVLRKGRWLSRALVVIGFAVLGFIAYQTNGPMSADVMFLPPSVLELEAATAVTLSPTAQVLGVALAGDDGQIQARAYPLRLIGYHHQVRDQVAGQSLMVTYCTVCRSGRVFSPVVDGKLEEFRLVGMDHWNAMFEDRSTGSWWRQVSGEAVAGPRRGSWLAEVPSRQMTLKAWIELYPDSTVLKPDPAFAEEYAHLEGFVEGTNESRLTGRNAESWQEKSWVVGVVAGGAAHAFDWNDLVREKVLAEKVGGVPVVLLLAADLSSFFAFDAGLPGDEGKLVLEAADPGQFRDLESGTLWTEKGRALDGPNAGAQLVSLPAYQEFWHSWRTFHPATSGGEKTAPKL